MLNPVSGPSNTVKMPVSMAQNPAVTIRKPNMDILTKIFCLSSVKVTLDSFKLSDREIKVDIPVDVDAKDILLADINTIIKSTNGESAPRIREHEHGIKKILFIIQEEHMFDTISQEVQAKIRKDVIKCVFDKTVRYTLSFKAEEDPSACRADDSDYYDLAREISDAIEKYLKSENINYKIAV